MNRLLVIGGGITGLAAAWRARSLSKAVEITVLEKQGRTGGKILTEGRDGFVLEAGADGFLSRKKAGIGLCGELGITDLLRGPVPRQKRSFVMKGHALYPLPEGFSGLVPANLQALQDSALLSDAAKLRVRAEPSIPARTDGAEESVAQFMTRRFGAEAFQLLMEPLLAGIYGGDASCLSMGATFPKLKELEQKHGSILKGLQAQPASSTPPFLTLRPGMAGLTEAIRARLTGVRVATGAEARSVSRQARSWRVKLSGGAILDADALIVAVPSNAAAGLLAEVDSELASTLASIPFSSTAIIHFGFRRDDIDHPLDGHGYVIPRNPGSDLLACTWTSSKWEDRAPPGMALLRLYTRTLAGDEELEDLAREELRKTMGISARPELVRVFRWPEAMPQYALEHPRRLARIEARCAGLEGLFLAGASYRGVGIPDCIESGSQAAQRAVECLT